MIRAATTADIGAVLALWERARSGVASTTDDAATIGRLLDTDPDGLLVD